MNRDLRDAFKLVESEGYTVLAADRGRRGKHYRLDLRHNETGITFATFFSCSSSDWRAWANKRAELRQRLREAQARS